MRVIQTKNDTVRLIFDPKTDGLSLGDFLIVRDGEDNFLGQIVEIYDDKYTSTDNVASIRLIFRILADYQVVPYDNYTPSRECEIAKIKLEEIEKFVNTDKTPVPFGISAKSNQVVNLNLDFFNNCPVVFADKLTQAYASFGNIAQKLKKYKKVVAVDFTGNLTIKNAKRIKAGADFKLPLDYFTLDYVWQKGLGNAPIELLASFEEMFIELKKFVNSTEEKYIPFPRFVKVMEQQYKANPAAELKLILTILRKLKHEDLFARSKKEAQGILKAVQKEDIVIVDLSTLKTEWHKEFLEFVLRSVNSCGAYFLVRLNENNSNVQTIDSLYTKYKNLSIISSISYGFKKLPQIMEFAHNYILHKTLNPRRDFGFANFQVAALNSSSFLAFGEDTKDFMLVLKNYIYDEEDIHKVEDKKIYINLDLELEDMTSLELEDADFEIKNIHIQKRLENEVNLEDVLEASEIKDKDEASDTPEEAEEPETENFEEPAYKGAKEEIEEEIISASSEEYEEEDDEVQEPVERQISEEYEEIGETEEIDEVEPEIIEENGYTLEEVVVPSRHEIPDIVTKHLDEAVTSSLSKENESYTTVAPIESADSMADLIEASLKNDEMYIKELEAKAGREAAKIIEPPVVEETAADEPELEQPAELPEDEKETPEQDEKIPVAEEDLDYFTNADEEEAEDGEMLEKAIETSAEREKLADEIEAQSLEEDIKEAVHKEEPPETKAFEEDLNDLKEEALRQAAKEAEIQEKTAEASEAQTVSKAEETSAETPETVESRAEENNLPEENVKQETTETAPADETSEEPVGESVEELAAEPVEEAAEEPASKEDEKLSETEPAEEEIEPKAPQKPQMVIEDFSEEETVTSDEASEEAAEDIGVVQAETAQDDDITLTEIAKKSIETRFDEVLSGTQAEQKSKATLKINENVSIDLEQLKDKINTDEPRLPIFNDEMPEETPEYDYTNGMKVSSEKYGTGTIVNIVKYSGRCLLHIEFESGKRLLDPKMAKIKPIE